MRHVPFALVSVLACCAAVAAPVPSSKPFTSDWDKPVDPHGDCKFVPETGALTIELPGGDHDFDRQRDRMNAPRVLRDVEGDFVAQVRVRRELNTSHKSSAPGVPSSVTAGLMLMFPDGTCIRFDFGAAQRRGQKACVYLHYLERVGGWTYTLFDEEKWPLAATGDHAYLKLERRGKLFRAFLSPDGEKWVRIGGPFGGPIPTKLKVGLAAYST
jgi:hypothetical protein